MSVATNDITPGQLKLIKTVVRKMKVADMDARVIGFSGGRTEKVSELTKGEAGELIKHLKSMDPDEASADRMRKKLIGLACTREHLPANASKESKREVVDRLNNWCKQYGYKRKGLNSYTHAELPKLIAQFEAVVDYHFKKV